MQNELINQNNLTRRSLVIGAGSALALAGGADAFAFVGVRRYVKVIFNHATQGVLTIWIEKERLENIIVSYMERGFAFQLTDQVYPDEAAKRNFLRSSVLRSGVINFTNKLTSDKTEGVDFDLTRSGWLALVGLVMGPLSAYLAGYKVYPWMRFKKGFSDATSFYVSEAISLVPMLLIGPVAGLIRRAIIDEATAAVDSISEPPISGPGKRVADDDIVGLSAQAPGTGLVGKIHSVLTGVATSHGYQYTEIYGKIKDWRGREKNVLKKTKEVFSFSLPNFMVGSAEFHRGAFEIIVTTKKQFVQKNDFDVGVVVKFKANKTHYRGDVEYPAGAFKNLLSYWRSNGRGVDSFGRVSLKMFGEQFASHDSSKKLPG